MNTGPVYAPQQELIRWAALRTPTGAPYRDDAAAIGIAADGALCAVVVFDTFTPWDCLVHICAEGRHRPIRELAMACGAYAFVQCGLGRVGAQISVSNRPALALARAVGFRREGVLRGAGMHGEGMVQFGLLRSEFRMMPAALGLAAIPRQSPARRILSH